MPANFSHVLTLVADAQGAPLTRDHIKQVEAALDPLAIATGDVDWLAPERACDIALDACDPDQVEAAVTQALARATIDCFAQPVDGRRKSLLLADMDSTIIAEESLDELAGYLGLKDKIAAITARAMAGELDFEAAITERVGLLTGLPETSIFDAVDEMTINPGAATLVATMKAQGARCLLVSGGFEHFTGAVAAKLGFDEHQGNRLEIKDGKMTGQIEGAIRDQDSKLATLNATAVAMSLPLSAAMTVGDGANDVPMLKAAGAGVAYHAKPVAAAAARFRINHSDLSSLLYIQGYMRSEFVT
ncbi:MAG: phosphoserine phosphatase SerB [Pseudomonadota bacterium]